MKLIYKQDIFKSKCEAIVNPVNTVGVMGGGLALAFKKKFPKVYDAYVEHCKEGFDVNSLFTCESELNGDGIFVVNFPTKKHWRNPSQLNWIENNLIELKELCIDWEIKSVAIPQLGCGLGGLDWNDVKPLIIETFKDIDITVVLFENI